MDELKFWQVYLSIPPPEGKTWATNKTIGIVAGNVKDIVEYVEDHYPTATIYNIQHRGSIEVLINT
jgi:hypothetical protein